MSATIVGSSNVLTPKPLAVHAPSGRSAVLMIAGREITEQLASFRFLIITFLVIGLAPLAVYVGARDYFARLGYYNRLENEKQSVAATDAGKRVRGFVDPFSGVNNMIVLRAMRPPEPLSVLVHGLDGALPQYWDFSATGIIAGTASTRPQRLADVLGTLDVEFLTRVALGLLAILLAFDAVAGEKEMGTLRAVLSQPISRAAVLAGKLLGGTITLLLPLMGAFLVALITAQLLHVGLLDSSNLARVGLLALTSGLYLTCFYALGLFVSSLVASQKTSLVFLLVIWVVAVLAIPPLATLVAQAVAPTDAAHVIEARKRQVDDDIRKQSESKYGDIYREVTGIPNNSIMGYQGHKDELDKKFAPIIIEYIGKRRHLLETIDHEAELRASRQNALAKTIMAISPAASFAEAAADAAGTGDSLYQQWLNAAQRHQSDLSAALFEDPPTVIIQNGGASGWFDRRTPPALADLPTFVPPRKDAAAAFNRALPSMGLLALFTGIFMVGGFLAFARYDVR